VGDDRAGEALDHLQTAALELIHAARAFLDVAEDVVTDRDKVADVVEVLGSVADAAARAARGEPLRGGRERARDADGGDDGDGRVEHITVT
jgi:hypothetical protein